MTDVKLVPLAQAAEQLNLSTSTLRHQIRNGAFEASKLGRDWVTTQKEIDRYRERHAMTPDVAAKYKGKTRKPRAAQ